tara:strand:- start:30 stop:251 length:222 start_codon:yes stop_codon:yes gene_type:complete
MNITQITEVLESGSNITNASFILNAVLITLTIISEAMPFFKESKCKSNGLAHAIATMASQTFATDITNNNNNV